MFVILVASACVSMYTAHVAWLLDHAVTSILSVGRSKACLCVVAKFERYLMNMCV